MVQQLSQGKIKINNSRNNGNMKFQLSQMFDRLSGKESKTVGSESMQNLQRIVLLEQQVDKLNEHIKYLYEQDRQLRLVLKNNKTLTYKEAKV